MAVARGQDASVICGQKPSCPATVARERLGSCGYAILKTVECAHENGAIILRGTVSSYFLKQIAQERIRSIEGVTRIINELEVQDDSSGSLTT